MNAQGFQQDAENRRLDLVEGTTPSKTKERKRPAWEEPVLEAPTSLARMNEERMKVKNECETIRPTNPGPRKC
jgi:hypothetical protein